MDAVDASAARQARLEEVLLAYLEAVEAGQRPDHQQLLESHPELTTEVREFFSEQGKLERWAEPLRFVVQAARAEGAPTPLPRQTALDRRDWLPPAAGSFSE